MYSTVIKYIGTTFALLAADHLPSLKDDAWSLIFDSSSLGGWIDITKLVCKQTPHLPSPVQDYCATLNVYKQHPSKDTLDLISQHLNTIAEEFQQLGYRTQYLKSPSLIRTMEFITTVRNKCAHGAPDSLFFSRIEHAYHQALRLILRLIPFSLFSMWGAYGSYSIHFIDSNPSYDRRKPKARFWMDSALLTSGSTCDIPFFLYREGSRTVYCLNDRVSADVPDTEFIDYASGSVIYREVHRAPAAAQTVSRRLRPQNYSHQLASIARGLEWEDIPFQLSSIHQHEGAVGVYIFTTSVKLGPMTIDMVLYVGKTTNLKDRLRSYLGIKAGYDDARPAISHMFRVYGDGARFRFCRLPTERIAEVERAIYETTMPEFNMIAPSF